MRAYIIIDVQNEFSDKGKRPVPGHKQLTTYILQQVTAARQSGYTIAWIKHFNKPAESPAFVPGTWGACFSEGIEPLTDSDNECVFEKNVYGAFTGTTLNNWLKQKQIDEVFVMGFYTHGCVSTTAREAIMEGYTVIVDSNGTGTCSIVHPLLGELTATDSKKAALMQLAEMGAIIL